MKDFYIADAVKFENANITSFFVLASVQLRDRKQGGQYLALSLADKSGQFEARMWEDFADVISSCSEGCYVKAAGQVSKYQGKFQITLSKLRHAADSEVDPADFMPHTQYAIADLETELRAFVTAFKNEDLKRLLLAFLDDPIIGPAFIAAPAAKVLHHAWIGGLLEHVVFLLRLCERVAPQYPEVDRDLLMTGAILHDIGKTRELSWKSSFSYTNEGQLIGHISIAMGMLREKAIALAPFPEKLLTLVEHIILSHHGKYEFGSPKLPMIPEAIVFSAIDDLEAKMQNTRAEFAKSVASGKDAGDVTDWVRSMERPLLNSRAYLSHE